MAKKIVDKLKRRIEKRSNSAAVLLTTSNPQKYGWPQDVVFTAEATKEVRQMFIDAIGYNGLTDAEQFELENPSNVVETQIDENENKAAEDTNEGEEVKEGTKVEETATDTGKIVSEDSIDPEETTEIIIEGTASEDDKKIVKEVDEKIQEKVSEKINAEADKIIKTEEPEHVENVIKSESKAPESVIEEIKELKSQEIVEDIIEIAKEVFPDAKVEEITESTEEKDAREKREKRNATDRLARQKKKEAKEALIMKEWEKNNPKS